MQQTCSAQAFSEELRRLRAMAAWRFACLALLASPCALDAGLLAQPRGLFAWVARSDNLLVSERCRRADCRHAAAHLHCARCLEFISRHVRSRSTRMRSRHTCQTFCIAVLVCVTESIAGTTCSGSWSGCSLLRTGPTAVHKPAGKCRFHSYKHVVPTCRYAIVPRFRVCCRTRAHFVRVVFC